MNYSYTDDDINYINAYYHDLLIKNFRNEYLISDKEFCEISDNNDIEKHKKIYEILKRKNKRIFDIIKEEKIIVKFDTQNINLLLDILKNNRINYSIVDIKLDSWIMFDKNSVIECANFGPINKTCPIYSFDEFFTLVNI